MRALAMIAVVATATPEAHVDLRGPGRFCGYSPIIDLREGEQVVTLQGNVHSGTFRWEGPWGVMTVTGIGWASRPRGRALGKRTPGDAIRFAERHRRDGRVIAIWNGRHGAAYFRTERRFTPEQIAAIDRVRLFQEGEEPQGCDMRTVFSWGMGE